MTTRPVRPIEAQRYPTAWAAYVNDICPRLGLVPSAARFREAVARHEAEGGQDQMTRRAAASRTLLAALDRRIEAAHAKRARLVPPGPIRLI